jgi:hypothetical protein
VLTYRSLWHAFGALVELGEQVRKPVGNALPDHIIVHRSQTIADVGLALAVERRLWNVAGWSGTHGYQRFSVPNVSLAKCADWTSIHIANETLTNSDRPQC